MSMTREEARKELRIIAVELTGKLGATTDEQEAYVLSRQIDAIDMALDALRPVSREQDVLGAPIHCSRCGWGSDHGNYKVWMEYGGHIFCGHCGAPMTDEAVQMVVERLEALRGETEAD